MSNKAPYRGNARFIELGSPGAPFRSTVNIDHIVNVRYEMNIQEIDAQYDEKGEMIAPPQQILAGWNVVLQFTEQGQRINFEKESDAVEFYNTMLDMIANTGAPISRLKRLQTQQQPANDEVPDLTDEELNQLENPEIDVDAIADAVATGVGSDKPN